MEEFQEKLKIIIALKDDLIPKKKKKVFLKELKKKHLNIFFFNKHSIETKNVLSIFKTHIFSKLSLKFQRPYRSFIIGMPNVGKSTFINILKKKKHLKIGNKPGITLKQQWVKISDNLEILDTPGIFLPEKNTVELEIQLALANIIEQSIIGYDRIAAYLFYQLDQNQAFSFLKNYGIKEKSNNINELLSIIAQYKNILNKNKVLDLDKTAQILISQFNKGLFPKISLESNL